MEPDTGSSAKPELAATLHRLRSTLARLKAELELAETDGQAPPIDRMLSDLREALDVVSAVEAATLGVVRVLVLDDDQRLGELTARGLRRLGYDAESAPKPRPLRTGEVLVLDLGIVTSLDAKARSALRAAKPILVTGAADAASRRLADDLDASEYLLKPVELADLAAAINRRTAAGQQ